MSVNNKIRKLVEPELFSKVNSFKLLEKICSYLFNEISSGIIEDSRILEVGNMEDENEVMLPLDFAQTMRAYTQFDINQYYFHNFSDVIDISLTRKFPKHFKLLGRLQISDVNEFRRIIDYGKNFS